MTLPAGLPACQPAECAAPHHSCLAYLPACLLLPPLSTAAPAVTIPSEDPLYRLKRDRLADQGHSTRETFQLQLATPLPPKLLPYLRLVHATREEDVLAVNWEVPGPVSSENELAVLNQVRFGAQTAVHRLHGSASDCVDQIDAIPVTSANQLGCWTVPCQA